MKRKKLYYFAYGSNMLRDQMNRRMHDFVPKIGTYKLKGWKLTFDCGHRLSYNSFANITEGTKDDYVEGVLYELNHKQLMDLDFFEGLYERVFFDLPEFGDAIGCVYIAYPHHINDKAVPTLEYLKICIAGAAENALYKTYSLLNKLKTELK